MSKSLSHLLFPALGLSALVIAGGVAYSNRDYAADRIELLNSRVESLESEKMTATETASKSTVKAKELQKKIAEIQAAASMSASQGGSMTAPAPQSDGTYGLGRVALPEEVAAWNVDVLPDGRGLPVGSGDVLTGEEVFSENCAACHGEFAEGVDNWPKLAGGFDTLADKDPVKTVGSYWPYLSTVWDYVHRSMPFGGAQTLSADEVYAIVAYILYSNDMVDEDFVLSNENFTDVKMHNADGFILDDREETEYVNWRKEPCMENCKDEAKITMHASVLDVTPDEGGSGDGASMMENHSDASDATDAADASQATTSEASEETQVASAPAAAAAALDADLVEAGKKVFRKCGSCHQVGEGAKNKTGPQLNGVMNREFASVEDFKYSKVFKAAKEEGRIWTEEEMAAFLAKPKKYMKGTKMGFAGLKKEQDIIAVTEYLKSVSQ